VTRRALPLLRIAFAICGAVAITYQYAVLDERGTLVPGNFFSFFTIESNLLAIAVLVLAALVPPQERGRSFDILRGGATLAMAITGLVFAVLLAGRQEDVQTAIPWVDFVVHKLLPIVLVVDWFVERPRRRLPLGAAAFWLAYPAVWFAYTLIRGAHEHWYPYPFVDVSQVGYSGVAWRGAVLLACFAAAAAVFVSAGNARRRPGGRARA
jgi:hypothetical protein